MIEAVVGIMIGSAIEKSYEPKIEVTKTITKVVEPEWIIYDMKLDKVIDVKYRVIIKDN